MLYLEALPIHGSPRGVITRSVPRGADWWDLMTAIECEYGPLTAFRIFDACGEQAAEIKPFEKESHYVESNPRQAKLKNQTEPVV